MVSDIPAGDGKKANLFTVYLAAIVARPLSLFSRKISDRGTVFILFNSQNHYTLTTIPSQEKRPGSWTKFEGLS